LNERREWQDVAGEARGNVSVVVVWVLEAVLLPAHGPGALLKRKGTKSQGCVMCPPPHPDYRYIAPVRLL
jgi:hypothetical protein